MSLFEVLFCLKEEDTGDTQSLASAMYKVVIWRVRIALFLRRLWLGVREILAKSEEEFIRVDLCN